jgi:hypothetical protein
MGTVEYSEYPFSYETTFSYASQSNNKEKTDKTDNPDKNSTPIIEGIADFCALNSSYENQYKPGWDNLNAANNAINQQYSTRYRSTNTNTRVRTVIGRTASDNAGAVLDKAGLSPVPLGRVHIFTNDFKTYLGSKMVNGAGIFSGLSADLSADPSKFGFAYEDVDGRLLKVDILSISGSSNVETMSTTLRPDPVVTLQLTDTIIPNSAITSSLTSSRPTRAPNGKLINTEQKNSGAEVRYNSTKTVYTDVIANTLNLSVGILAAIVFIAKA